MFHVKQSGSAESALGERLALRGSAGLLRIPHEGPYPRLVFCSNDYLGYAAEEVRATGQAGAGASRLVAGQSASHRNLERALSEWLGYEDTLTFTSGYAANVGALAALFEAGDQVFSDASNHASIIDGIRLSKCTATIFPHNDLDALECALRTSEDSARAATKARWVVTESYFSMDADTPDLRKLRALCDRYGASLVLDETHALGIFGPEGRGLAAACDVKADIFLGAFGKAFGSQGGFVSGPLVLRTYLWNCARSFVFSTGLSPLLCDVASDRLAMIRADGSRRERLTERSEQLRTKLASHVGSAFLLGHGPIVPWVVGAVERAVAYSKKMHTAGIYVYPIRPPTVQEGTSRLRITVTAAHSIADVDALVDVVAELVQ
jgi:8-amino-7-oxononanoate synthase